MTTKTLTANQSAAVAVLRTMGAIERNRAIVNARATGLPVVRIADAIGLSVAQVYRILRESR